MNNHPPHARRQIEIIYPENFEVARETPWDPWDPWATETEVANSEPSNEEDPLSGDSWWADDDRPPDFYSKM